MFQVLKKSLQQTTLQLSESSTGISLSQASATQALAKNTDHTCSVCMPLHERQVEVNISPENLCNNEGLFNLSEIQSITFGKITEKNIATVQELIDALALNSEHLSSLTEITIGNIERYVSLRLQNLETIVKLTLGFLGAGSSVTICNLSNLTEISTQDLYATSTLTVENAKSLKALSFGIVFMSATIFLDKKILQSLDKNNITNNGIAEGKTKQLLESIAARNL